VALLDALMVKPSLARIALEGIISREGEKDENKKGGKEFLLPADCISIRPAEGD